MRYRPTSESFDYLFPGPVRRLLEWPTIALTLLVTLATGWLGGLINWVGSSVGSAQSGDEAQRNSTLLALLRRAFLGVTAALGIFLLAGSGLLILTSQSAAQRSGVPIELSPYFVAFLAFISGFLADDAFAKLTTTARGIFAAEPVAPQVEERGR